MSIIFQYQKIFGINQKELTNEEEFVSNNEKIFLSQDVNLEYVKTKYNTLINSDIVIRDFIINARGKQYKAFIVYIDGMINSENLNNFVLKPLMMRNKITYLKMTKLELFLKQ